MERSTLTPFVKWPGGKTRELDVIWPQLPNQIRTYYEPFLGGGAVYWAMPDQVEKFKINDRASQLTDLYLRFQKQDQNKNFIDYLHAMNEIWIQLETLFDEVLCDQVNSLFLEVRAGRCTLDQVDNEVDQLVSQSRVDWLSDHWRINQSIFLAELKRRLSSKMKTMVRNETRKGLELNAHDVRANLLTGVKDGFYMYVRWLFNHPEHCTPVQQACVYYFIRMFCYSSMFRFNQSGAFNVPYGGMSYNRNHLTKKLEQMQSQAVKLRLARTTILSGDFEGLFEGDELTRDDFFFLDPPYDSEFSTYELNTFGEAEQRRLASFLIDTLSKRGNPKWMMVIKSTSLIRSLYDHESVRCYRFDKTYGVSFMDRNDRAVEHLMFTNYDP